MVKAAFGMFEPSRDCRATKGAIRPAAASKIKVDQALAGPCQISRQKARSAWRRHTSGSERAVLNITGVAGEYFVAAELLRRGWIATVTLKNTPMIDVLAIKQARTVIIQVKTRSEHNRKGWIFGKDVGEKVPAPNFYIALVDLVQPDKRPDYYLIPKNVLADWISKDHQNFVDKGGRDNPIRALPKSRLPEFEQYHDNWELLESDQHQDLCSAL